MRNDIGNTSGIDRYSYSSQSKREFPSRAPRHPLAPRRLVKHQLYLLSTVPRYDALLRPAVFIRIYPNFPSFTCVLSHFTRLTSTVHQTTRSRGREYRAKTRSLS